MLKGFRKTSSKNFDADKPVPLEAVASNLEARLAMAPNYSDPSFVQKNYRMPAPPVNEAARQDFVEKLHVPRSHHKADEATRLLAELLEVSKQVHSLNDFSLMFQAWGLAYPHASPRDFLGMQTCLPSEFA